MSASAIILIKYGTPSVTLTVLYQSLVVWVAGFGIWFSALNAKPFDN